MSRPYELIVKLWQTSSQWLNFVGLVKMSPPAAISHHTRLCSWLGWNDTTDFDNKSSKSLLVVMIRLIFLKLENS